MKDFSTLSKEFEYYRGNANMILPWLLPPRFVWEVSNTKHLSISINFLEFDKAATESGCRIDSARETAIEAMRFILTTPKYASFLNSCVGLIETRTSAVYMEQYLTQIGRDASTHHSHISEQDAINYFFGVAPIPDEKILMMM